MFHVVVALVPRQTADGLFHLSSMHCSASRIPENCPKGNREKNPRSGARFANARLPIGIFALRTGLTQSIGSHWIIKFPTMTMVILKSPRANLAAGLFLGFLSFLCLLRCCCCTVPSLPLAETACQQGQPIWTLYCLEGFPGCISRS